MRTTNLHSKQLVKLLKHNKIATIDELKTALGTSVNITVYRKLREVFYHTSYSHRGRYYTLDEVARFDDKGLWSYRDVRFSMYGNLLTTAEIFVKRSEAGYYAGELEHILNVGVKEALLKLVRQGRITHKKVSGLYLNFARNTLMRSTWVSILRQPIVVFIFSNFYRKPVFKKYP
ncbi:MAG: hypothetical protein ABIK98_16950 [Pseudomonadota bacterium]